MISGPVSGSTLYITLACLFFPATAPEEPASFGEFTRSSRLFVLPAAVVCRCSACDAFVVAQVPGVVSFDRVRARRMGPQTLVDLTIQTDDMISASAAGQVSSAAPVERVGLRMCA